jgi:hypothetical protein
MDLRGAWPVLVRLWQRSRGDRDGMADQSRPDPRSQAPQPDTAADVDADVAQLLGLRPADAPSVPTADEIDDLGQITDTRIYQGDLEARPPDSDQPDRDGAENLEDLTATELREGETDDPNEAAEEGLTWVPPTDPPVRPSAEGEIEVAAGFGTTSLDEPFDQDHHASALSTYDEIEARVAEALRGDASTSGFADDIEIEAEGDRVVLSGVVDDIEDEDAALAVAENVDGIREAVSRLGLRSLADSWPTASSSAGPSGMEERHG